MYHLSVESLRQGQQVSQKTRREKKQTPAFLQRGVKKKIGGSLYVNAENSLEVFADKIVRKVVPRKLMLPWQRSQKCGLFCAILLYLDSVF